MIEFCGTPLNRKLLKHVHSLVLALCFEQHQVSTNNATSIRQISVLLLLSLTKKYLLNDIRQYSKRYRCHSTIILEDSILQLKNIFSLKFLFFLNFYLYLISSQSLFILIKSAFSFMFFSVTRKLNRISIFECTRLQRADNRKHVERK